MGKCEEGGTGLLGNVSLRAHAHTGLLGNVSLTAHAHPCAKGNNTKEQCCHQDEVSNC